MSGEIGLLVGGMVSHGVIPQNIYVTSVVACLATTIVSPFLIKTVRKRASKQQERVY